MAHNHGPHLGTIRETVESLRKRWNLRGGLWDFEGYPKRGFRRPVSLFSVSSVSWCKVTGFALPCCSTIMLHPVETSKATCPGANACKTEPTWTFVLYRLMIPGVTVMENFHSRDLLISSQLVRKGSKESAITHGSNSGLHQTKNIARIWCLCSHLI